LPRKGRIDEVDLEQVAEEIADLGLKDERAVRSRMRRLLMHLSSCAFSPGGRVRAGELRLPAPVVTLRICSKIRQASAGI
jgi:Domain of unknown function DUF29